MLWLIIIENLVWAVSRNSCGLDSSCFCVLLFSIIVVVLLKARVRVERLDVLGFQEARHIEEIPSVEILLPKYLI